MEKTFFFIDGVSADRNSKRQMRRHVMKGKNTGKLLHRRSRLGQQVLGGAPSTTITAHASKRSHYSMSKEADHPTAPLSSSVDEAFGHALLALILPTTVEITASSLCIINEFFSLTARRLYPERLGVSLDDAKISWLPVLFQDADSYHCNVDLMQACNEILKSRDGLSNKGISSLSQTLVRVRERIMSEDALSDSSLALVLTLVIQEQLRNQINDAEVHLRGLHRMIELRGGLDQLEGNSPLVLKTVKTGVLLSFQSGKPATLFRDHMDQVRSVLYSKGAYPVYFEPISKSLEMQMDPCLREVFVDLMEICTVINNNTSERVIDLLTFEEIVVSVGSRLLNFRSLEHSERLLDFQTVIHVGLVIFMLTTFLQLNHARIMEFKGLSACLHAILSSNLHDHDPEFLLWVMVTASIWAAGSTDGNLVLEKIRAILLTQSFATWESFRNIANKFPWIHAVHDEPASKIWSQLKAPSEVHGNK